MSQLSGTNYSSHHRASASKAQMFSSSWLCGKHGMSSQRCSILHVGHHLPLQLLCLGFHLAASARLWQRGEHLERSCWKPAFTSEVVRLTYGSGRRQGEDLYMLELLDTVGSWWQLWRCLIVTNRELRHSWRGLIQLLFLSKYGQGNCNGSGRQCLHSHLLLTHLCLISQLSFCLCELIS